MICFPRLKDVLFRKAQLMLRDLCVFQQACPDVIEGCGSAISSIAARRPPPLASGNRTEHGGDQSPFLREPAPRPNVAVMPAAVESTLIGAGRPPNPAAGVVAAACTTGRGADLGLSVRL